MRGERGVRRRKIFMMSKSKQRNWRSKLVAGE
jgi:hypothetical protein